MWRSLRFEQAEARAMLSITPAFSNGVLTFTGDDDSVNRFYVATNASDNVTLIDHEILGGIAASSVTSIVIYGGDGTDLVDLMGVLPEKFTSLTSGNITVYGGASDDIIEGSPFGDILDGGEGNDQYAFVGSVNFGSDTIVEAANADKDTIDFSYFTPGLHFLKKFPAFPKSHAQFRGLAVASTIFRFKR